MTANQLGVVIGTAACGALYLNLARTLPSGAHQSGAFVLASGHAYLWTVATLAIFAAAGAGLALAHARAMASR